MLIGHSQRDRSLRHDRIVVQCLVSMLEAAEGSGRPVRDTEHEDAMADQDKGDYPLQQGTVSHDRPVVDVPLGRTQPA